MCNVPNLKIKLISLARHFNESWVLVLITSNSFIKNSFERINTHHAFAMNDDCCYINNS
jgi:hypothetical protein